MYPNNVVAMEKVAGKTAPDADGVAHDVVADIALDLGPEVIVIDFAVVSPGASLYMEYPTESPLNQDGAAKHMERNKRSKYAKIAPPSTPPLASVTPFVIEASGRLGPAAISFLLRFCPTQRFSEPNFSTKSLSYALALWLRCFGLPAIVTVATRAPDS
jgi:hypothetical protein